MIYTDWQQIERGETWERRIRRMQADVSASTAQVEGPKLIVNWNDHDRQIARRSATHAARIQRCSRLPRKVRNKMNLRERLSEAQNHRCAFCGCCVRESPTIDEVVPRSQGGRVSFENSVVACLHCNGRRANGNAYDFYIAVVWGLVAPAKLRGAHAG